MLPCCSMACTRDRLSIEKEKAAALLKRLLASMVAKGSAPKKTSSVCKMDIMHAKADQHALLSQ